MPSSTPTTPSASDPEEGGFATTFFRSSPGHLKGERYVKKFIYSCD